ncbi:enamine deaminase RidA (YjgF/YER057c/UK114 family) [Microbacterium phyllosphaerae]|uniref:Enamine deaminase RidA (YjgF/YER057c/UK114 family) n=1 Tax=Microbacterium phyllosphaerae TaxID=124798 RepID=A0ABS4WU21_9MICO|nr:RidA family protein [Microbacterium phyllosphaerae]MBP2379666.1 enamine deaminase RidA (YjgF/YER057c/UK114 family) [Microbacterium phyllosphaerae]
MSRQIINPDSLVKPIGFAHGVRAGAFVYLGGQTAMDAEGRIVPGGIVEQFVQAFSNVLTTLAAAGGEPSDLVDVTIYLTDVDDYQRNGREIGRRWRELAGTEYPAMAGIGVTRLWQPEALIEIQGVAHVSGSQES